VVEGKSIFITGGGGTGKTFTLMRIIKDLKKKHGEDSVYVTASTGLASSMIGGTTIHYFAGVGTGVQDKEVLLKEIIKTSEAKKRWMSAKVLIVDEISMIDCEMLDKLDYIAKKLRQLTSRRAPMGGIQVILCGDFYQLPPIKERERAKKYGMFAFESKVWKRLELETITLTEPIRQSDDVEFSMLLEDMRKGIVSEEFNEKMRSRINATLDIPDDIEPTFLFSHRVDVEKINERRLNELPGDVTEFKSFDRGSDFQLKAVPAPKLLRLKINAQVLLVKNIEQKMGLVNGTKGVVTGFALDETKSPIPVVRFENGTTIPLRRQKWEIMSGEKKVGTRTQIPLMLAWAITIHKSQGMTLEYMETSIDENIFESGQAYVALSRARTLKGLSLKEYEPSVIKAHDKVKKFYGHSE
jgi:ATP-dependent DNA helicase PIF1